MSRNVFLLLRGWVSRWILTAACGLLPLTLAFGTTVAASDAISGASGTVFVTERQLGSVTAYDAATGTVLWTSTTGAAPIGVVLPHGTGKLYTSDEGSNRMSVFDARTGTPLGTIAMGSTPHHLSISRNGERIYVGEFGQNTIGVVDTSTDTEIAHWIADIRTDARTHATWITRDSRYVYATNTRVNRADATGNVAKVDAGNGALLCNTTVGSDPSEVLTTPNGMTGYVTVRGEDVVKELDLSGPCPVLTGRAAFVGDMPDTLQLTNDLRTLVVALRDTTGARVALLDTDTFVATIVEIPGHRTTGHHWLSANGRYSFVAIENASGPGGLAVVDNQSGAAIAYYPYPNPGGTRPHGVFFVPEVLP
jgi:DNA-binding beta-propeller fold protein YncE